MGSAAGSGSRDRTCGGPVNSRLLCQLSYPGASWLRARVSIPAFQAYEARLIAESPATS